MNVTGNHGEWLASLWRELAATERLLVKYGEFLNEVSAPNLRVIARHRQDQLLDMWVATRDKIELTRRESEVAAS